MHQARILKPVKIFQCKEINDSISTFILTAPTSIFMCDIFLLKKRVRVKINPLEVDILELISRIRILKPGCSITAELHHVNLYIF